MMPKLITLTHANQRQPIDLAVSLIAGWYWSEGHKCMHVVSTGGAVFPALESREEITRKYNEAMGMPQTNKE